jgi:Xaa-Pro dipeptidase
MLLSLSTKETDVVSKTFFEKSEFETRQARTRQAMAAEGIDLLLVIAPANINYLVGVATKAYQVFQCLLFPLHGEPTLLIRLPDVAEARDHGLVDDVRGWGGRRFEDPVETLLKMLAEPRFKGKKLGIEWPAYYVSVTHYRKITAALGTELKDATSLIESLKLVKSPAELSYVRKAAAIADVGIDAIAATIAPGSTERAVAAEAHRAMMAAGGDSPASPMNFVSGERTAYGHGLPSDRVLRVGDFMHVEFGGAYRRYCSTIARHFNLGAPSLRAQHIHDVTLAACDAAISIIRSGVPAVEPHLAAVDVIRKAGLEQYNLHTTGYGIAPGFPPAWGENLNMFFESKDVLEAGMVVSIEPPIFIPPEGIGGRLIDCVIVTDTGAERLSQRPRDIIQC